MRTMNPLPCPTYALMAAFAASLLMGNSATASAQATEQKTAESYQTFYLNNATGQNAANDIQTDLRNMLPRAKMYYVYTTNALSIRGSAEDLALAQKILAEIDRPQKTYRVIYTISQSNSQAGAEHFVLLVTPGNKTVSKQGTRVPIMTGQYREGEPPNAQVQYMDIGLNIEASLQGYGDGLRLISKIEETSVSQQKSTVGIQDPIVDQSMLEGQSAVVPGKPVALGSVEVPGGKHMEVEVTTELIR